MSTPAARDADVLIAGGGPVGLVAAIEARRAGLEAIVIEPRTGPVDKACGEGLMPGAVPMLGRLGVRPHGMALRGIRYVDRRSEAVHRFTDGVGLGVRRTALHAELAARAAELGVRVVEARVDGVEQDDEGVRAAGLTGSWLVACDGLHSGVARAVGLARAPSRLRRYGMRRHARTEPWSELVEVHWTPVGEVYVTPVDDRLVGVATLAPQGTAFVDVLAAAPGLAARLDGVDWVDRVAGAGPFGQCTRRRVAGRVLLAGDASGYVDAITGEGLRLGFEQAAAAIARIAEGRPLAYEQDWARITRRFRRLTSTLAAVASTPARSLVVPAASRLPRVFGAAVDSLAR